MNLKISNFKTVSVALIILILIVLFLILNVHFVDTECRIMEHKLKNIQQIASAEDFGKSTSELSEFEEYWNRNKFIFSITMHHQELNEISSSLSKLKVYLMSEERIEALAELSLIEDTIKQLPNHTSWRIDNVL